MNTQRIEGKGVTSINDLVFNSNSLVPHLDFNDRTDSWDGFIFVYSNDTNKKSNLLGRIPVQVKASNVKDFSGKVKTKVFDVSDLTNYKNDGGVIIFCVEYCGPNRKIYYTCLLPYDLDQLLKGLKVGQKSRNVSLEQIQMSDVSKLENMCREFLLHRKKQFSMPFIDFPQDKIKEYMMQGVMSVDTVLEKMLLSRSHYLYWKTHPDSSLYDCVTKINIEEIKKTLDRAVSVGNKEYYPNYHIVSTKNNHQLLFGKNVKFTIERDNLNINYSYAGTLDDRINDSEFIIEFISKKAIKISETDIPLFTGGRFNEEEIQRFKDYNKYLVNTAALLNIFRVDHLAFEFDSISKDDEIRLKMLINSMVLNNSAPKQELMPAKCRFKIGNINLLTFISESNNSKVEIHDFSTLTGKFQMFPENTNPKENPKSGQDVSKYILLNLDDIILCSNIRLSEVIESVISYEHTLAYHNNVLLLTLDMIKAYDKTKSQEYLDCANKFLLWLEEGHFDESIINVNKLQINKRERQLTHDELKYLYNLKEEAKENTALLCGISILLEDVKNFNYYFKTLQVDERTAFENYPIYSLLKQ